MSDIQIVPTTPAYLPGILDQARATFEEHRARYPKIFPYTTLNALENFHRDAVDLAGDASHSFSAVLADAPAGYVLLLPKRKFVLIYDIGAFPQFRRRGVGSSLLRHVLRVSRERKWDKVAATVWDGNTASHHMFRSTGFKKHAPFLGKLGRYFPRRRLTLYTATVTDPKRD